MSLLMPPDLEAWATSYLRSQLSDVKGLQVDNKVPAKYSGSYPLVVVRDDSGAQTEMVTFDRSLGITVYLGPVGNVKPVRDLALRVYALLADPTIAEGDNPIAAITLGGFNGPYAVPDDPLHVAAQYLTAEYSTVGEIL